MRNIYFLILFFCSSFINSQTIVSTEVENKNAIVEESTGIHCPYCPDGHRILNEVIDQNPNDVFVIKFHEGGYAWDCSSTGGHNFNNNFANQLGVMGQANGQPSASVNRRVFSAYSMTGGTAMSRGAWPLAISQILQEESYVNLAVEAEIVDNELTVHVEAYYTGTSPQSSNFINIAVLQNETIGPQSGFNFNPDYIASAAPNPDYAHGEYDYRHMNRLVHMINGIQGDLISDTTQGSFVDRYYSYTMPNLFNDVPVDLSEIEIVAFITDGNEIQTGHRAYASFELLPYDISVDSIDSPSTDGIYDDDENITITLTNEGENEISNFDIIFQINGGNTITESFSGTISSSESVQYTSQYAFDLSEVGDYTIEVTVSSSTDENEENNSTSINITNVGSGDCPDEYDLPIVWRDNFECYEPFSISDINGWYIYDLDGEASWGSSAVNFTNESYTGSGIIFNYPLSSGAGDTSIWNTYEGNQGLYFFDAVSTAVQNNDWMISPEFSIQGIINPVLSFWAKSVTDEFGLEKIKVSVGNSTNYNDFSVISSGNYVEIPTQWTEFQYDLSDYVGQTIRIGINYIGDPSDNDSFVLQMDNFKVEGTLGYQENNISNFEYYYDSIEKYLKLESDDILKQIEVYNILGQMVINEDINNSNYNLNLNSLSPSIYIFKVQGENGIRIFKLSTS